MQYSLLLASAFVLICAVAVIQQRANAQRLPGPLQLPAIGNTLFIPKPFDWTWYQALSKIYGPIFRLRILRDDIIVVSDHRIAEELLGRRSINYSSRKFLPYAGRYRSGGKRMLLMAYDSEFIKQRTAMQQMFRTDGITANRRRQKSQALKLLMDFERMPGLWNDHLKSYSSGVALGIVFGMNLEEAHRRMPKMVRNTASLGQDLEPGRWLSEVFPLLDRLPDYVSGWRGKARAMHAQESALFGKWAEEARRKGTDDDCLLSRLWKLQDVLELDDKSIAYIGGSIGEAGTNTTQCMLACFLHAYSLWPTAMSRAKVELDVVVGDRLPDFSDYHDLPCVFAVVKETLRWIPVTPLSIPHLVSASDTFDDFDIPSSSLIVTSIWNMHRDPANFPDPDTFDPTRFYESTPEKKLPEHASLTSGIWTFGFGKRSCPGKRLAVDSVWLAVAHLLWAFDITHVDISRKLKEEPFSILTWRDAVNIEPRYLSLGVSLRSVERGRLIREEWESIRQKDT